MPSHGSPRLDLDETALVNVIRGQAALEKWVRGPKLGTFLGVYTPSILTILGVVLFLRTGGLWATSVWSRRSSSW